MKMLHVQNKIRSVMTFLLILQSKLITVTWIWVLDKDITELSLGLP